MLSALKHSSQIRYLSHQSVILAEGFASRLRFDENIPLTAFWNYSSFDRNLV